MVPTLDAVLLEGWADAATTALERHRAHLDRINVFPVADRDTGTNLLLTMRAATAAVRSDALVGGGAAGGPTESGAGGRTGRRGTAATAEALALGALRGARGNSGVILSQVLRGMAEAVAAAAGAGGPCGGLALADALDRAVRLASRAVSRPREGTVLTVLAAAAVAARTVGSDRLEDVAVAAAGGAAAALRETTGQLPELARAGVVDAGGLGLCVVLDALATLVAGREPLATAQPVVAASAEWTVPEPRHEVGREPAYEVMYLLDGSDEARVDALRATLDAVGDAVAVVGDGAPDTPTWTVHVHCTDIGAVVEAGLAAGRPHAVRVVPLVERPAGGDGRFVRGRAVLVLTCGPHVTALAREAGADVLQRTCPGPDGPATDVDEVALERALAGTGARHVALLPCDPALAPVAERAAAAARRSGQEVVVVPAASAVAGLAALAVHDPDRHAADDVVAMTEAAAGTRTGAVQVAESEALTWAGRCRPGDVLGLADGEVVLIAPDLSVGALWLASRMVAAGGELVTVLLGDGVPGALGERLAAELHRAHPEVDVVVHRGARPGVPVELGVE